MDRPDSETRTDQWIRPLDAPDPYEQDRLDENAVDFSHEGFRPLSSASLGLDKDKGVEPCCCIIA